MAIKHIQLGISLLDENGVPTMTLPIAAMGIDEEAARQMKAEFGVDPAEELEATLLDEAVHGLKGAWPLLREHALKDD